MNEMEAIVIARKLMTEWVGNGDIDIARIHASMLQEHRANLAHPYRVSPGNARATRGALVLLGKVRKALK